MERDPHVLLKFLYDNPQAWPARMALIEELIRDGEVERAKTVIRESPDDSPMPLGYPARIHTLMTRGIEGLASLPPLEGFVARVFIPVSPHTKAQSHEGQVAPKKNYTLEEAESIERSREKPEKKPQDSKAFHNDPSHQIGHQYEEPTFDFEERVSELSESGTLIRVRNNGGAAALVETKTIHRKVGPKPGAPKIDQNLASVKWENYSGKLKLADGTLPEQIEVKPRFLDRISALSFAVLVHLIVAILVSLVVITIPRPTPPALVVTMPDNNDGDDLIVHTLTKPAEVDPSAAARQAVNVETALGISDFALPEVENTQMLNVTAMIDGVASAGAGMSLSVKTHQQSDVNFFGISSGGNKIVFVIDATKPMLVDEKGGMFAYNKVKEEIGAMLSNLNRGTKFNILAYSGKTVQAFREELVPGLPSNLRLAMEWLSPLNSDYENLGLTSGFGVPINVADLEGLPIQAIDVAHYTKCIQKAMEWQAAAIFCISGGYEAMGRSPTPEMRKKMMDEPQPPRSRGEPDPADKARFEQDKAKWDAAVAKTQEWLRKENEARMEKGLAPKVVLDPDQLVKDVTGESPPRRQNRIGATPPPPSNFPPLPPITFDDIDLQLRRLVIENYQKYKKDVPSVHMVIFLGEDEKFSDEDKEHFGRIVKRNNGKLRMLRGLAELKDVTGK